METREEELFISNLKENIEDHPASSMLYVYRGDMIKMLEKIYRLEATLEVADALIDVQAKSLRTYGRHILIENQHDSYNQLKSNQQSPNS